MSTITLTPQQIATFHVEGFLHLPPITTLEEIVRLRGIYDDLFARRAGHEQGNHYDLFGDETTERDPTQQVPQILGPERHAPELRETMIWASARAIATQLFGMPPETFNSHAILKPAGCPKPTPWHQDEAYWGKNVDYLSLSMWIPLQDVDTTSGCMHFVPRSHWGEILPHRPGHGNAKVHGLELDGPAPEPADVVAVPLPAGGCTIHHQRLLHYTTPNRAAVPRRAWIIAAGCKPRSRRHPKALPWVDQQKTERARRQAEWAAKQAAVTQ